MERTKVRGEKGEEPPDPKGLSFPMVWLRSSEKKTEQAAPGEPPEGGLPHGKPTDNGAADRHKGGENGAGKEKEAYIDCSRFLGRNQLPIKLEFKIPKNTQVFNCASTHKEWFILLKKLDPIARIITYKEAALSDINSFPKNQAEYNKCFPHELRGNQGSGGLPK